MFVKFLSSWGIGDFSRWTEIHVVEIHCKCFMKQNILWEGFLNKLNSLTIEDQHFFGVRFIYFFSGKIFTSPEKLTISYKTTRCHIRLYFYFMYSFPATNVCNEMNTKPSLFYLWSILLLIRRSPRSSSAIWLHNLSISKYCIIANILKKDQHQI
jgi:hypothetical protein